MKNKITLRRKNPGLCQICLNPGHWSYECEKKRAYLYRPSALTRYKNKSMNLTDNRKRSKKPPKYKAMRRDRRRFGYESSDSSSDESEDEESEQEEEDIQEEEGELEQEYKEEINQGKNDQIGDMEGSIIFRD